MPGERQTPTHEVFSRTVVDVVLDLPAQTVPSDHDQVNVCIDGDRVPMTRGDWQQFVACVRVANEQVNAVLDTAGRILPGKVR